MNRSIEGDSGRRSEQPVWRAWQVHYHGDQDRLLTGVLGPLLAAWSREHGVSRAFFVRYLLGGPHLRWRVRVDESRAEPLDADLRAATGAFFGRHPSPASWSRRRIREANARLLARSSELGEDRVLPDHHVIGVPYPPETARYGGQRLLGASHDLFTLSALASFETLRRSSGDGGSARQHKLQLFVRHAVGSSSGLHGLARLLGAPPPEIFASSVAKADALFERRPESFIDLLAGVIEHCPEAGESAGARLESGASLLAQILAAEVAEASRDGILGSHLHMTANRLGLSNAEEFFFARLILRAAEKLLETRPAWAESFGQASLDPSSAGDPAAGDPSAGDPSAGDPSAGDRLRLLADSGLEALATCPGGVVADQAAASAARSIQ